MLRPGMIIVFRRWYFVGVTGLALTIWGAVEAKHSTRSKSEPIDVEIEALHDGDDLEQPYVRLGRHIALHDQTIMWGPERGDRIDWVLYPIVPSEHPYVAALDRISERYEAGDEVPEAEWPVLWGVNAFVLCKQWGDESQVPLQSEAEHNVEGIVFTWDDLDKDEKDGLRMLCRDLDKSRVRVLEFGRRPKPFWVMALLGTAGVLLLGLAVKLFFGTKKKAPAAA